MNVFIKFVHRGRLFSASLFLPGLLLLAGCSSPGYQKGNAAAYSMQTGAQQVQIESGVLDTTMAALKDLVNNPSNLQQQYQRFSKQLDLLIAAAQRVDETGKRIQAKGAAYFQSWDRQLGAIDYEYIRTLSQTRRTEATNHFADVTRRYQENQQVVQPVVSYLKDIRTALGSDLTLAGVQSMKDVVANAEQNAAKVQTALASLVTDLNNSSAKLSSSVAMQTAAKDTTVTTGPASPEPN